MNIQELKHYIQSGGDNYEKFYKMFYNQSGQFCAFVGVNTLFMTVKIFPDMIRLMSKHNAIVYEISKKDLNIGQFFDGYFMTMAKIKKSYQHFNGLHEVTESYNNIKIEYKFNNYPKF